MLEGGGGAVPRLASSVLLLSATWMFAAAEQLAEIFSLGSFASGCSVGAYGCPTPPDSVGSPAAVAARPRRGGAEVRKRHRPGGHPSFALPGRGTRHAHDAHTSGVSMCHTSSGP